MRVVVPLLPTWPKLPLAHGLQVQIADGLTLTIGDVEPLPANAQRWAERQVADITPPDRLRMLRNADRELPGGWPVSILECDALDHTGQVL